MYGSARILCGDFTGQCRYSSPFNKEIVMRAGAVLTALLLVHPLYAQHQHHEHSADLGNLGTVHFVTSCNVAAQADITRGVALIHSFWYSEAEKSFRKAAVDDPTCGIAWWG